MRIKRSDFDRILEEGYSGNKEQEAEPEGPSADDFWGGEAVGLADSDSVPVDDAVGLAERDQLPVDEAVGLAERHPRPIADPLPVEDPLG